MDEMSRNKIVRNVPSLPGISDKGKLTFREMHFVREYLSNGRNSADAYIVAYGPQPHRKHTRDMARRLLKLPKIQDMVHAADAKVMAKTETIMERYAITQERIIEELVKIAFSDPRNISEWDSESGLKVKPSSEITDDAAGAIAEVAQTRDGIKIKNYDKQQALLALGKHLGMFTEKVDHRHLLAGKLIIEG